MTRTAMLGTVLLVGCFLAAAPTFAAGSTAAGTVRVKDLGKLQGWRENVLVGTGIVTGLAGTGDSGTNRATRQALSNAMSQFNLTVAPEQIQSRNVAVVMVTASLPAFAREGDSLDVTVTSTGDARSLVGGSLLLTPLRAPNGRVYALGQTMFTWLPKQWRPVWAEKIREIPPDAPLHPTVMQRYGAAGVSHYGLRQPYRPPNLAAHQVAAGYRVPTTSEPIDTAS